MQFAGELADLRWKALRSRNEQFVIGDRPMVMHDPTPRYPFSGNGIKSSPTAYTLMPLTPSLCLRLDQTGAPFETRRAERQVERINLLSYGWAERFVYARGRTVLEELHARVRSDPDLAPGPRPDPQVICEEANPDDPTVGAEHPPGYPRGLWYQREDGSPVYMSYRLQYGGRPAHGEHRSQLLRPGRMGTAPGPRRRCLARPTGGQAGRVRETTSACADLVSRSPDR